MLVHAGYREHDAALHGHRSANVADPGSPGGDWDAILMGEGESLGDVLGVLGEDHYLGGGGKVPLIDGMDRKVILRLGYFFRAEKVDQLLLHGRHFSGLGRKTAILDLETLVPTGREGGGGRCPYRFSRGGGRYQDRCRR